MRGAGHVDTGEVPRVPPMELVRWLTGRLRPHLGVSALVVLALAGMVAMEVIQPVIVQMIVDDHLLAPPGEGHGGEVTRLALFFLATVAVAFVLGYVSTGQLGRLGAKVMFEMREALFGHLVRLRPKFFQRTPVGVIVHRISNDVQAVSDLFTQVLNTAVRDLLLITGVVVAMIRMDAGIALWVLIPLPVILVLTIPFGRWVFGLFDRIRNFSTLMIIALNEILRGLGVLRAFDAEAEAQRRYFDLNESTYKAHMDSIKAFSLFDPGISLAFYASNALLFLKGVPAIMDDGTTTIGVLVAMLAYTRTLYQPLHDLAHKFHLVQGSLAGVGKVHWLMTVDEPDQRLGDADPSSPWPLERELRVEGLEYGYTEGQKVLQGVDFALPRGRKLAIVGSTGAGKSTLVKLLMAYYMPQGGGIYADDRAMTSTQVMAWRRGLAFLPQEVTLFHRSVLDNIRLHDEVDRGKVEEVLDALGVRERLEALPDGLDTVLAEGGRDLSLGERQIVSIARALVFDPEVLILDEATSSIDPEMELLVTRAIDRLLQGRTAILIAHRLSTVRKADEIVVMHEGRIVERGAHDDLMEAGGRYYNLVRLQLQGEAALPAEGGEGTADD